MANEISVAAQFTASKGGATIQHEFTDTLTMSGSELVQQTQVIATSATAVDIGAISGVPGIFIIQNLDGSNFIELATDNGMANKFAKLLAGEWAVFPPSSGTFYAKADTGSVRVLILATSA